MALGGGTIRLGWGDEQTVSVLRVLRHARNMWQSDVKTAIVEYEVSKKAWWR